MSKYCSCGQVATVAGKCLPCYRRRLWKKRKRRMCIHCEERIASRPKGLCTRCYYTPGVRESIPGKGWGGWRSPAATNSDSPLPEPTTTIPGSLEKERVLSKRALLGESLFHPRDAKIDLT